MAYASALKQNTVSMTNECTICQLPFNDPRVLECSHEFCKDCIGKWIVNSPRNKNPSSENGIDCPICRQVTVVGPPGKGTHIDNWAGLLPCSDERNVRVGDDTSVTQDKKTPLCDPCTSTNKNIQASVFCTDCQEHLCLDCHLSHKKLRITKGHNILEIGTGPEASLEITELKNLLHCSQHKEKEFEFFCRDHGELVCPTCAFLDHRHCTDIVELQSDGQLLAGCLPSAFLTENAKSLQKHVTDVISIQRQYEELLQKDLTDLPVKLKMFREMVMKKLERFAENILQDGRKMHAHLDENIKQKKTKCEKIASKLEAHVKITESLGHMDKSSPKHFVLMHALQKEQELMKAELCMEGNECLPREFKHMKFQVNEKLTEFLNSEVSLGGLKQTIREKKGIPVLPKLCASLQDFDIVHVKPLTKPIRTKRNSKPINCQFVNSSQLLIADTAKLLHVVNVEENKAHQVGLRYQPWGMAVFPTEKKLVLSHPHEKRISIYNMEENYRLSHEFKTRHDCYGLANYNGDIVVSLCEDLSQWSVQRLNIQGETKQMLKKDAKGRVFKSLWYFAVDGNNVYQSCGDTNQVYKFDINDGTPHFQYKHAELTGPGGITVDSAKNVFVCGMTSKNVHVITYAGKLLRIFTPKHCAVPLVLSCYLAENRIAVVDRESGAHLYRLQIAL